MHETWKRSVAVLGVSLTLGPGSAGLSRAQEGHKHEHGAPLHGGKVVMTREYHFEVAITRDGLTVYPRTHADQPIDASRLSGRATFYHPNSPKPWFDRTLVPNAPGPGQTTSAIGVAINLSRVPATGAKVEVKVEGLPEAEEPTATFTVPIVMKAPAVITFARATASDQAAINAQRVCKVSGKDLFAMGGPLKVSRGDQSTFICCQGCLKQIQANPDKYLGASAAPSAAGGGHEHQNH